MSRDRISMTVVENKPTVMAELTYDERRKLLRNIIFSDENDLTLTEIAASIGYDTRNGYKYVQNVMKHYPGKKSEKILDKIEHELRVRGFNVQP